MRTISYAEHFIANTIHLIFKIMYKQAYNFVLSQGRYMFDC